MAVTVNSKTIRMTAEGDEWLDPIRIKTISWIGATGATHLLEISESSNAASPGVIHSDEAAGSSYVSRTLVEEMYPFGIEITDLDSGYVEIVYS